MSAKWFGCNVEWRGSGLNEHCIDVDTGKVLFAVSEEFYRPADVNTLLGDSTKARTVLGWNPVFGLEGLVADMCFNDSKKGLSL